MVPLVVPYIFLSFFFSKKNDERERERERDNIGDISVIIENKPLVDSVYVWRGTTPCLNAVLRTAKKKT